MSEKIKFDASYDNLLEAYALTKDLKESFELFIKNFPNEAAKTELCGALVNRLESIEKPLKVGIDEMVSLLQPNGVEFSSVANVLGYTNN